MSTPHQRVARFVVIPEIPAESGDRHQPVGAAVRQGDEQPETRHAGDAAGQDLSDSVREIGGGVAVHRVALGRRRAALGRGDLLADLLELLFRFRRRAPFAELQARDQSAMHQKVGIAADG